MPSDNTRSDASGAAPAGKTPAPWDRKDPHPERAVTADPDQKAESRALDRALKETFPASDPPAISQPLKRPGKPKR